MKVSKACCILGNFRLIDFFKAYKLKITRLWYSFGRFWSKSPIKVAKDSDVKEEAQRIQREVSSGQRTDLLTVHKLKKNFGSFTAVDGLSFGVRHGEMFGFLGVNGAGKSKQEFADAEGAPIFNSVLP